MRVCGDLKIPLGAMARAATAGFLSERRIHFVATEHLSRPAVQRAILKAVKTSVPRLQKKEVTRFEDGNSDNAPFRNYSFICPQGLR